MAKKFVAPDGGWGWMVVLGAALINLVNQSMFANFGLIFGEYLKELGNGHATAITLVMALSVVVTNFSGLLVGPMLKKISIRTINIVGITFVGGGLIICSFSTTIWQICVGYGGFTGLGLGLLASATFLVINDFFTTKKSTAVGLSMAGTSVGQMVMPTFIGMLLKKYDFSRTTFILGFLSFSGFIGALLFEPIFCCKKWVPAMPDDPANDINSNQENSSNKDNKSEQLNEETTLLNEKKPQKKQGMLENHNEHQYKDTAVEIANSRLSQLDKSETVMQRIVTSLGLPLLKDLTYVHILIGLGFGYVSSISFSTFFPMFLQDEVNFSLLETTSCMTALSFSDVLGRITAPEICRRLKLTNRSAYMIGCLFLAFSRSCLVELSEFKYLMAVSFFVGFFRSITVINQNLVISEYIDNDKLPSAVGLNMVTKAVLTLTFGQSLGFLKDMFSYGICIHILNAVLLGVVLGYLLELLVKRLIGKKQDIQEIVL